MVDKPPRRTPQRWWINPGPYHHTTFFPTTTKKKTGTLGVVTKVAIHVPPAPKAVNVALVGLESFAKVQEVGRFV